MKNLKLVLVAALILVGVIVLNRANTAIVAARSENPQSEVSRATVSTPSPTATPSQPELNREVAAMQAEIAATKFKLGLLDQRMQSERIVDQLNQKSLPLQKRQEFFGVIHQIIDLRKNLLQLQLRQVDAQYKGQS